MPRLAALVTIAMLMAGCRAGHWAWVDEEPPFAPLPAKCRGGVVNTEKRITDISVVGRTRNTVTRTDACLD